MPFTPQSGNKGEERVGGIVVLFTETMKESINILISMRKKADVTQPYLFSRPRPHTKALKGTAAVRRYSIEAGLKKS